MNGECKHNRGVICDGGDCSECGWDPTVVAKRKAEATGMVEVYDETRQKVIGKVKWPVLGCMSDQYG